MALIPPDAPVLPLSLPASLIFLVTSTSAIAADAPAEGIPQLGSTLAQLVGGLALIVALLLGSLWLIKRLSGPRGATSGLKVLGAVPVGARERVVLVEIADQVLVLGVTQTNVNTLHSLAAEEFRQHGGGQSHNPSGDFQGWLSAALERRRKPG